MHTENTAKFWVYWALASMTAALVGGLVFPWLQRADPFKLGAISDAAGG